MFVCVYVCLCVCLCVCPSQHTSLVFASSSTVYGHHTPLPFSPPSTVMAPSNIYAATKISNERFARLYCLEYGLKAVGVRFFTAYGPWGRPDMAVYRFTERMYRMSDVVVHNSTQPIKRDFTFISDVVGGVLLALEHMPVTCGRIYNIGSGQSVELRHVLKLLEEELNVSAKIVSPPRGR